MTDLRTRLDAALGDAYTVGERVGEGGMSFVYSATDHKHRRPVAIKVLRPEVSSAVASERFLREIEIAAGCAHPHILPLHDSGVVDGIVYFVMPLVEGATLADRIDEGPVSLEEAVRISGQIAAALDYAHERGLVHRDVKPANVLMISGQAVVTDFGVARALDRAGGEGRLTGTGDAIGTVAYMSPEQADGTREVDGSADQYALASMVWELLTGQRLFAGLTPVQIIARKVTDPSIAEAHADAVIPTSVRRVLERATAADPAARYPDVSTYQRALAEAATTLEMARVEAAEGRRARTRVAAAILLLGAVALGGWWMAGRLAAPDYGRLALLPLRNAGPEDDGFFVEGMHEDLIGELQEAGISIIGRRSVLRFADDVSASARDIATQLGIDAVLEGTAERRADSVAIAITLLDGDTDVQVWQEEFVAPARRIYELYQRVATALAEEIGLELSDAVRSRLANEVLIDPRAYEAYVRGQFHWNRLTAADLDLAENNFQLALSIDPDYAQALAGMAALQAGRQQMGLLPPEIAVPQWERYARAALEADSTTVLAWGTLAGLQAWAFWDWRASLESHERGLELNPSDAFVRAYYSHVLLIMGRPDEALAEADRALRDDPLNNLVVAIACVAYGAVGSTERAEELCETALDREPSNPVALHGMLIVRGRQGDDDQAARLLATRSASLGDPELARRIETALAEEGPQVAARRGAEMLEEAAAAGAFVQPTRIVTLYAYSDTPERALPWLTRAVEFRDPGVTYMGAVPLPPEIAGSAEMTAALEAVGVPNQHLPR